MAVPVAAMRELAAALRLRNLALGVTWFRRLREAVDALPATGPSDADRPTGLSTPAPEVVAPDAGRSAPLAPAPQP